MITFTVIIPAYESAAYIGDAIESVVEQTHPPHEIIVCDDGSSDDLISAIAPYRHLVQLKRQKNRGVSAASNTAARGATGDFLVRLDADDTYLPRKLERLAEAAVSRPDLDVLTTDAYMEADGVVTGTYYADFCADPFMFVVDDQRRGIVRANFIFGQAAIRRTCFEAHGGFDESLRAAEDWDLWVRVILNGSQVGLIDEPLAYYRRRAGGLSSNVHAILNSEIAVLEKVLARNDISAEERDVAAIALRIQREYHLLTALKAAISAGDFPDVRRRAWTVALMGRFPLPTRVKALVTVLAPKLVANVMGQRSSRK